MLNPNNYMSVTHYFKHSNFLKLILQQFKSFFTTADAFFCQVLEKKTKKALIENTTRTPVSRKTVYIIF